MFNVGDYTFAPWKVVWRGEVATALVTAVVSLHNGKVVVPDQTAYMIPFEDKDAAHFLCALMNSVIVRLVYLMHTYKHVSMSFVQRLTLPQYDPGQVGHKQLSLLSQRAHELAPRAYHGDEAAQAELRQVEEDIDRAAAQLWGLSEEELAEIKRSLEELKGA